MDISTDLTRSVFDFVVKKRVKLMKKKWPWNVPEEYFDRSIKSLREEYNIFVLDKKELHFDNPTYI